MFNVGDKIQLKPGVKKKKCPAGFSCCGRSATATYTIKELELRKKTWNTFLFEEKGCSDKLYGLPLECLECFDCFELAKGGFEFVEEDFELVEESKNQQTTKEVAVNETIAKTYEKTADAVLVNKWFGSTINSHFTCLMLKLNATHFLAEAKRLEAEEEAKKK